MLSSKLGGEERAMFVEPNVLEMSGDEQQGVGGVRWGEGKSHRWYGRERCCTAIVGILRWWKSEGSLIDELSSDPEIMFLWRPRFQGEATAAVDDVQQ